MLNQVRLSDYLHMPEWNLQTKKHDVVSDQLEEVPKNTDNLQEVNKVPLKLSFANHQ